MNVRSRMIGLEAVQRQLSAIDKNVRDTALEVSVRKALFPLEEAIKAGAPTQDIRAAVRIIGVERVRKSGGMVGTVGVPSKSHGKAFLALWFELGTALRFRKSEKEFWAEREGNSDVYKWKRPMKRSDAKLPTGRMTARPFMRPAMDRVFPQMQEAFAQAMAAAIEHFGGRKNG